MTGHQTAIILRGMAIEKSSPQMQSIVSLFGGIEPMARILGHKHGTTVRGWVERDKIPYWRIKEIHEAAKREGIKLPRWFRNGGPS